MSSPREQAEQTLAHDGGDGWAEYVCAHSHRWRAEDKSTRCPVCGTITFKTADRKPSHAAALARHALELAAALATISLFAEEIQRATPPGDANVCAGHILVAAEAVLERFDPNQTTHNQKTQA